MPRLSRFDAILFDKDGTLVDFDATFGPAGYGLLYRLSNGNVGLLRKLAAAIEYDVEIRRFRQTSPFVAEPTPVYGAILADILGRVDRIRLFREIDAVLDEQALRFITPIGDPPSVLANLAQSGLELGIATNDAEHTARRQAERLGVSPFVHFYAGYDSGHGGKPGPGMVLAFARHCGCPPSRIALVGDSLQDMLAARAAGSTAIAVLSGPTAASVLSPHADHLIGHTGDLPALLAALG
jgi:phosphoglycolate phosphatase